MRRDVAIVTIVEPALHFFYAKDVMFGGMPKNILKRKFIHGFRRSKEWFDGLFQQLTGLQNEIWNDI